jgi:hypothetical protein
VTTTAVIMLQAQHEDVTKQLEVDSWWRSAGSSPSVGSSQLVAECMVQQHLETHVGPLMKMLQQPAASSHNQDTTVSQKLTERHKAHTDSCTVPASLTR